MQLQKFPLHWQILLGMLAGGLLGALAVSLAGEAGSAFVTDWIKPWGTIFINLLKLMAVPLVITSLIKGISDLKNVTSLSQLGLRTLMLYFLTTFLAIVIGLGLVNLLQPGSYISEETRIELMESNENFASNKVNTLAQEKEKGPLRALVDLVPGNIFEAMASNSNMLQVIFFVVFLGIGMITLPEKKVLPFKQFIDSLNDIVLQMIDLVMLVAPLGVFALLAALVAESPGWEIFKALGAYSFTVVLGLFVMLLVVYPLMVRIYTGISFRKFQNGIAPAQLVAFSTSSSAATLPVTMERVEEHLGVEKNVSSFVCPVGATINMDGTSLYQAVAAVFISQAFGDLVTLEEQLIIVTTALMASIGSAAVPGAGILMLIIVLEAIGVDPAGIALIFAIDRPLDMLRTSVNVTGDAAVSVLVAKSVGSLKPLP
jgi:proton glutamate symport protein